MSQTVPQSPLRRLLAVLTDLLFPPRCGGCGAVGAWLCAPCIAQIEPPYPAGWACGGCGAEWGTCRCVAPELAGFLVVGTFDGPLRKAIHRLKYGRQRALAPALARLLALGLGHTPAPWGDALPPLLAVPLHPRRTRERGFSQTQVLAQALADQSGYPLLTGLARIRATPPQVQMSGSAQRQTNMIGAFAWQGAVPPPSGPLLLLDDVYTSGATMAAAAQALREAGAGPIYGVALARPQTI